jgi:DNA-binding MarR family transcriptional regulator
MPTATAQTVDLAGLASRMRVVLWRLTRKMRRGSAPGITPTLHAALHTVELHGPITVGQLSAHEGVAKPTMTRTVQALLEQELISRTIDPLDGRVSWLTVTPQGLKLLQRTRRRTDQFLAKRMKHLSPHELSTLEQAASILERLAEEEP